MVKAVYIHIPFCKTICTYCSFCKLYYDKDLADKYLLALKREIETLYQKERISTIYIGGGTPSDLTIEQLQYLLDITQILQKDQEYEFTFECNCDIDESKLRLLKSYGVNRLSFGIETVHSDYLKILGRKGSHKDIIAKIQLCRSLGFDCINGDLMYAFHLESIDILKKDLEFLVKLNLEHISTYSLMIEEHTKLYLDGFENCDEELDAKMYYYIHDILQKHGYYHYEVSNFSKKNCFSKHNMTYWKNLEYYGFGLGASGYIGKIRYTNTKSFQNYIAGKYRYQEEVIDKKDKMCYELILGLRTKEGINQREFFQKYQIIVEKAFDIDDLIRDKYLVNDNERIYIPCDKWYVMNSILERFVE